MIQLTKINLILNGVAVVYGYIVFALHSCDSLEDSPYGVIDAPEEVAGARVKVTGSKDLTEREEICEPLLNSSESDEIQIDPMNRFASGRRSESWGVGGDAEIHVPQ